MTEKEHKELQRAGKLPHVVEKPKPKDPSVQAIEGIGKALSDHLKAQEREASTFREDMRTVLNTVVVAMKDGREVKVELPETREWQEIDVTVVRNSEDLISKLKMKRVK